MFQSVWLLAVWLENRDWILGVDKPVCGAHQTSYAVGTPGTFCRLKEPGPEADHSHLYNAMVMNTWSYTSAFPYILLKVKKW
jgi:hypothetical protein